MPERRSRRLLGALAAAGALALVAGGPAALAQTDVPDDSVPEREVPDPDQLSWEQRWAASALDAPFDVPGHVVRLQPFAVSGVMRYEKARPADHIVEIEVRVVPEGARLGDGCTVPDPVVVPGSGPQPEITSELPFFVNGLQLPCNGAYALEVEATVDDPSSPTYTLRQPFDVGVLPDPVTDLAVDLDEPARRAAVTFTPLSRDQLAPDAIGYVLERGGPVDDGGSFGTYVDVATLGVDDRPRFVDDLARVAGGTYEYRVRAVRGGAREPERSSILDTETARITIGEPSETPTTDRGAAITRGSGRGGAGATSRRGGAVRSTARATTPTTLDTGFEGTLDYGTRGPGSRAFGDEPLAGQSIIQDEGEGLDLAAPVAGALVLVGWAGHIAYLNRLAKQL